jgi:hypothetical protein
MRGFLIRYEGKDSGGDYGVFSGRRWRYHSEVQAAYRNGRGGFDWDLGGVTAWRGTYED